jgi:hypothetical protein
MPATNSGFASGGSNVPVRHFFVHLSFVARSEFSVKTPPERKAAKRYQAHLDETFEELVN